MDKKHRQCKEIIPELKCLLTKYFPLKPDISDDQVSSFQSKGSNGSISPRGLFICKHLYSVCLFLTEQA